MLGEGVMNIRSAFRYSEWSLKRKLFGYMLLLALLLVFALLAGLFSLGQFTGTRQETFEALDIQMEIFEKDISSHFDNMAAASITLSEDMTELLESELTAMDSVFSELTNSDKVIQRLQNTMIQPLKQSLLRENCSGVFVMLNATVNSSVADAEQSRTGIYLQVNGYEKTDQTVLLYRGLSEVGKKYDIMPHRKWRLEFRTDLFPNYDRLFSLAEQPLEKAFLFTDLCTLPGTSDKVMLVAIPMIGTDGTCYGICGYEISASYFMTYHAQPSKIDHMTCLLIPGTGDLLDTSAAFSAGISNGYYRVPTGTLEVSDDNGLVTLSGDAVPYVGVTRSIRLSPNNDPYTLITMILKSDFERENRINNLQNIILYLLLLFFAVNCCMFFSHRFLTPILKDLEKLKYRKRSEMDFQIPEINDLFTFLAEKDRESEGNLDALLQEKRSIQTDRDRLQQEFTQAQQKYEAAQAEIARLAYSRKQEIDPDDYQRFLSGFKTLTPAEKKIFSYYMEGKSVKEITVIASIKESTLRYHNQNIYSKLGVNSLKQLLRYATLMQQEA